MAAPGSYPQPGADDHFKQPAEPSSNGRTVTYGPPQQSGNNHSQNDSHRRQERRDGSSSRDRSRSRSKDKARQTSSERRSGSERDQPSGERRSGSERDGQGGERRSGFGRGRGQSQGQQLNVGTWNSSHHQGHYNKQTQYQSYKSQQNYYGSYHNQGQGSQYHRNANGQWSADDYTFLSKTLSSILRHNAERFGLKLMKGGFLYVDDILKGVIKLHGFTLEDVKKVVEENDKKRFALEQEGNRWKVRANQGHSIEVDGLDLKPVTSTDDFPIVIHGTYYEAWDKIKNTGLKRMTRNHIHFAAGEPGQNGVISGMRSSCEVIIYLDLDKALKDGLKFFQSANNVILCEGDKDGYIYPCYFSGVLDRKNRSKLDFDHTICSVPGKKDKLGKSNEQSPKKNKRNKKKNKNKEDEDLEADGATSRNGSDRNQDDDDDNVVFQEEPTSKPDVEMPDATDKDKTAGEEKGNESKCCDMKSDNEVTATTDGRNVDKQVVEGVRGSMEDMDVNTDETKDNWDEEEVENTGDKLDWSDSMPKFLKADESVEVVERLITKPPPYVVVCCVGENLSEANVRISTIVILAHPDIYVYHLCDDNSKLVKDGNLKSLLLGKVEKVFFDVGTVSRALIREYDVLLDSTPIWDIEMVYEKVKIANMDLEEVKQSYGFTNGSFKKWRKVNETCGEKLGSPNIDDDSLTQVIEQGKCIAQLYKYCKEKLNPEIIRAIKKVVYKAAVPEGDEELGEKVKALQEELKKQKQANKGTDQPQAKPAENKQQQENKQGGKQGGQQGRKKKGGQQGGGNSKKGRGKKR